MDYILVVILDGSLFLPIFISLQYWWKITYIFNSRELSAKLDNTVLCSYRPVMLPDLPYRWLGSTSICGVDFDWHYNHVENSCTNSFFESERVFTYRHPRKIYRNTYSHLWKSTVSDKLIEEFGEDICKPSLPVLVSYFRKVLQESWRTTKKWFKTPYYHEVSTKKTIRGVEPYIFIYLETGHYKYVLQRQWLQVCIVH